MRSNKKKIIGIFLLNFRTIYDESCLDFIENEIEIKDEHIDLLHAH